MLLPGIYQQFFEDTPNPCLRSYHGYFKVQRSHSPARKIFHHCNNNFEHKRLLLLFFGSLQSSNNNLLLFY